MERETMATDNKVKDLVILNKKEGETPLKAIDNFRLKNKKYKDVKMTYAGRLDPLASGLLVVLAGDAVHEKEKYLKLWKEYEFEVLFGFATDTYDILGKVSHSNTLTNIGIKDLEELIKKNLKHFKGKFAQKYPMYSSKTVDGKPLFSYARSGAMVEVPEREVEVKSLQFRGSRKITPNALLKNINSRISKVSGDFRQKEILKIWHKELSSYEGSSFPIASFKIKCSSGTYVRSFAHTMGEKIGIPALALTIKRTKIGKWSRVE
jgi:tRNA pseudouridine55 synthase